MESTFKKTQSYKVQDDCWRDMSRNTTPMSSSGVTSNLEDKVLFLEVGNVRDYTQNVAVLNLRTEK